MPTVIDGARRDPMIRVDGKNPKVSSLVDTRVIFCGESYSKARKCQYSPRTLWRL